MPRLPKRSASHDGPWMKRQRQMLLTLALFAGCTFVARYSAEFFNTTTNDIPRLRQGNATKSSFFSRIREKELEKTNSQRTSRRKDDATVSPFQSAFDVVPIPVNPSSTLLDDIISIEHLPALSRIDIRLKHGARCPKPYLMGRLSGPALVLLHDWKWSSIRNLQDNTKISMLSAHYQVPDSGLYHLEVIALHCRDFLNNMKQSGNRVVHNETKAWHMSIDKSMCMEDPWRHRLTKEDAILTIDHTVGDFLGHRHHNKSYWRNQEWLQNDECRSASPSPILTRFRSTTGPFWGERITSNTRSYYDHDLLHFESLPSHDSLSKKKIQEIKRSQICLIGSSQSHEQQRLLRHQVQMILGNTTDAHLVSSWGHIRSPEQLSYEFARNLVQDQKCRKLVFFPWSESSDGKHTPTTIRDFYDAVSKMIHNANNARSSLQDNSVVEIYVVSLRYRSLNAEMTACPPRDWRSPSLIDAYNHALAKACNDLGETKNKIIYLDTTPFVNPMWDFSEKSSPVGSENRHGLEVESRYLTKEILGLPNLGP